MARRTWPVTVGPRNFCRRRLALDRSSGWASASSSSWTADSSSGASCPPNSSIRLRTSLACAPQPCGSDPMKSCDALEPADIAQHYLTGQGQRGVPADRGGQSGG